MNFFKSILSDDPDSPEPEKVRGSGPDSPLKSRNDDGDSKEVVGGDPADGWSFGGLIKTLAIRSESVIEIYRRDLQEFKSGLQKETEILRETASRAVKDLPASLEARASAAHGALDGVLKSTTEIISKETRMFASDGEPETPETNRSLNSGRYSWFDAQLSAIQSDSNTFCEDPEDVEYRKWKSGFELEENTDEINSLIGENGTLEAVYRRLVPNAVGPETFWCRYFYRVDKLKQQESVRASLVKRAISVDDEEELSWDIDDDEEHGNGGERLSGLRVKGGDGLRENVATHGNLNPVDKPEDLSSESKDKNEGGNVNNVNMHDGEKNNVVETVESSKKSSMDDSSCKQEVKSEEIAEVKRDDNMKSEENVKEKDDEKVIVEEKGESCKKSDAPIVSSHQSKMEEEEDMGWDEIEDIGSDDEKKVSATTTQGGNPNRVELRKRLSAVEDDDDDLNWDIEDDDGPVKA